VGDEEPGNGVFVGVEALVHFDRAGDSFERAAGEHVKFDVGHFLLPKRRKRFFFKKKNQKTFVSLGHGR
jgi:hypothetical protein